MYTYDADALARTIIEERIHDAHHRRMAREVQRRREPSTGTATVHEPRRRSRLWTLVHPHHAYS